MPALATLLASAAVLAGAPAASDSPPGDRHCVEAGLVLDCIAAELGRPTAPSGP